MSATATVAIPAITAIIIQGIQAWMMMARSAGMSPEEMDKLFIDQLALFNANDPSKLPDAVEGQ